MGVPIADATAKFLVLSYSLILTNIVCPAKTEVIHIVQPLSFSTTTKNLLGENILKEAELRID